MKHITWKKCCFVLLVLLQLTASLQLVWRWEDVLQNGQSYRWQTAPVDPYDALRGRYLLFSFPNLKAPLGGGELTPGQQAYGLLERDERGYARLKQIQAAKPQRGDYIRLTVQQINAAQVTVALPFDRLYLEEMLAPEAEKAYRAAAGREAAVAVKIKNGEAAVEELYIENVPLRDYLKR